SAATRSQHTGDTFESSFPERSSAVMVFAKSGAEGSWVIAATSAAWSAKACSKAGRKCSGLISANGGVSNGVCHAFKSGFSGACEVSAVSRVSDINHSCFRPEYIEEVISRDGAFLGLLRLIAEHFSGRLRPKLDIAP